MLHDSYDMKVLDRLIRPWKFVFSTNSKSEFDKFSFWIFELHNRADLCLLVWTHNCDQFDKSK